MESIKVIFKFMRNLSISLVLEGILVIVIGVLIIIVPDLLAILVAIFLIASGIICFVLAYKVNKYSKFEIKL